MTSTDVLDIADRPIDELSGGQRQRVWIAMALAQETDILLLDEPTTFLDLTHQFEVLDLLVDLNKPEERTIVLVLHDLNQACRFGDHLIAMKDGAIVAEGNPREVITEEVVQRRLRPGRQGHPRPGRRHPDGRPARPPHHPHRRLQDARSDRRRRTSASVHRRSCATSRAIR